MLKTILIADDSLEDLIRIQRVFKQISLQNPTVALHDGAQLLSYLDGVGEFSDRTQYPLPALVLMDLRMPFVDGFEVLLRLQNKPRAFAIVVLSALNQLSDIRKAYELGSNSFLTKPLTAPELLNMVSGLKGLKLTTTEQGSTLDYQPTIAPGIDEQDTKVAP